MEEVNKPFGYPYLPRPTRVASTFLTSVGLWAGVGLCVTRRFSWLPAAACLFGIEKRKKLVFEFSLAYIRHKYRHDGWCDRITKKIIVGRVPLLETGDLQKLQGMGVTVVISMLEPWEQEPAWFVTPQHEEECKRLGIRFINLPSADFYGVSQENLQKAAAEVGPDDIAYCHCKAGHGRGPSAAAAVMINGGMSADDAIERLKEKRPGITLREHQSAPLKTFEQKLRPTGSSRS
jgi:Swiss Army Knife protein, DSP-PTPase phosphatase domain